MTELLPQVGGGQATWGGGGRASPLMMDFMSHFTESMLCNAIRSSPGFRGDKAEFPSPAVGEREEGRRQHGSPSEEMVRVSQIRGAESEDEAPWL